MLKLNELKVGDLVYAEYDGQLKEGEITDIDHLDEKACIMTSEDQEFWYELNHIKPIALDESQLFKLGFQKQENTDGSVKYMKGAFRLLLHHPNDFFNVEMWYREDQRHVSGPLYVHDLQNKFHSMTKVLLTKGE